MRISQIIDFKNKFLNYLFPELIIPERWKKQWQSFNCENLFINARIFTFSFAIVLVFHYFYIDLIIKEPNPFWAIYRFGASATLIVTSLIFFRKKISPRIVNIGILFCGLVISAFQTYGMILRPETNPNYIFVIPLLALYTSRTSLKNMLIYSLITTFVSLPAFIINEYPFYTYISFLSVIAILIIVLRSKSKLSVELFISEMSRNEFTNQVHHDLQSPIVVLKHLYNDGKSELIKKALAKIESLHESLRYNGEDSTKLLDAEIPPIIEDVVNLKREEWPRFSFNLNLKNLENSISLISPLELSRIISNLLNNAVESYQGGFGSIDIYGEKTEGHLLIKIKDQGTGISTKDKENIFKKGFSSKGVNRGLGLMHAKSTIEKWGGSISFETSNEGTTFKVSLQAITS